MAIDEGQRASPEALRGAAERIDADLVERMQAQAIEGPWPAGERILASVGPDPISPTVVRHAKRLADLMNAPWLAVTVERPGHQLGEADRRRIDEAVKLAETLGAETRTLIGNDLPAELLRLARFENVTQIVIGRSAGGLFAEIFRRSLPHELVRRAEEIVVHVVTGRERSTRSIRKLRLLVEPVQGIMPYVWSTLAVAAAVGLGEAITLFRPLPNLSMIFLMAVLFPAVTFGMWPAIYASVVSVLAYNFFFIEPIYTFTVAEPVFVIRVSGGRRDHFGARRTGPSAACARPGASTSSPASSRLWRGQYRQQRGCAHPRRDARDRRC
jgi:two-component system sensor histidine kinase KdpD